MEKQEIHIHIDKMIECVHITTENGVNIENEVLEPLREGLLKVVNSVNWDTKTPSMKAKEESKYHKARGTRGEMRTTDLTDKMHDIISMAWKVIDKLKSGNWNEVEITTIVCEEMYQTIDRTSASILSTDLVEKTTDVSWNTKLK
jgi:hypothetical protein